MTNPIPPREATNRSLSGEPLSSFDRAERLFKQAEKLGCDTPTEGMIADAIQDAEFDTLHNYDIIARRHGQTGVGSDWTGLKSSDLRKEAR